jgi:hypothetical protein
MYCQHGCHALCCAVCCSLCMLCYMLCGMLCAVLFACCVPCCALRCASCCVSCCVPCYELRCMLCCALRFNCSAPCCIVHQMVATYLYLTLFGQLLSKPAVLFAAVRPAWHAGHQSPATTHARLAVPFCCAISCATALSAAVRL